MNILQAVPQLNVGGVETGTVDMAKYLMNHGHKCVVVSGGGELVKEMEACGIRHYRLPMENKAFWVMLKAAGRLQEIIKKEAIDIVHARSRVPAWISFMAVRRTDATFITTAHGHYSRHIFSTMMGWGKYTIVPSSAIGKHMLEDFGVPRDNIRLIPRSVDLEKYRFRGTGDKASRQQTVGVVGRITPIKGQIYFLKAMARVVRSLPLVKAWIVGSASPGKDNYKEELEVWTRRLGLSHIVEFLGNRRDIPQILSKLDCLVMPSIAEESFGRVIVEAQAVGVPVVATRVGGVVEIVDDGRDGLLVYPRDDEALAEAILKVLSTPSLARELAEHGRKKVEERFSLERMAQETLRVYSEALSQPRLLVIKISAVGDAILATPSFKALKKKFPRSRLVCLCGKEAKEVFCRCPYIDELLVCDLKDKDKGWRPLLTLAKRLMRRRFDAVIDFQNNRRSHFLSYATFSFRRYGYDNGKFSFFLNQAIKDGREPLGPVAHQFRVLGMLGITYEGETLELWPSDEDKEFAENFLREAGGAAGPLVGLNIGASTRWESKRWPAARFAALCDELECRGYRALLTGAAGDAGFAELILKQAKSRPACAVARTTLLQLACLIRACGALVTGDSAPMHVAAAVKTPFVALFGPTDPKRHLPPAEHAVVLQGSCPPCYKGTCKKKDKACMTEITVDEVMKAIEGLLKEPKKA